MSPLRPVSVKEHIIYGPVTSRRLGRSLGINVLGSGRKICTFDCLYCQLRQPRAYAVPAGDGAWACDVRCHACPLARPDRPGTGREPVFPSVKTLLEAVREAAEANPGLRSLTLSGNGEPTLHPEFPELVEGLRGVRDSACPGTPITVLSNSSTVARPGVTEALRRLDRRIMKLDTTDPAVFRALNRPCPRVDPGEIVDGLASLDGVILQALFVGGTVSNQEPELVEAWLDAVAKIRPPSLQIYSLDRVPAESGVIAVSPERLREIAAAVTARIDAQIGVY